jgi:hypothetical protein
MKGSCVLFLLNLQNKLVGFILAPLLNGKTALFGQNENGLKFSSRKGNGNLLFSLPLICVRTKQNGHLPDQLEDQEPFSTHIVS